MRASELKRASDEQSVHRVRRSSTALTHLTPYGALSPPAAPKCWLLRGRVRMWCMVSAGRLPPRQADPCFAVTQSHTRFCQLHFAELKCVGLGSRVTLTTFPHQALLPAALSQRLWPRLVHARANLCTSTLESARADESDGPAPRKVPAQVESSCPQAASRR